MFKFWDKYNATTTVSSLDMSQSNMSKSKNIEPPYKLITSWNAQVINEQVPIEKSIEILESQSIISNEPFQINVCDQIPMSFYEEAIVVLLWFILFGLMLYGPFVCIYGLLYHRNYSFIILLILFVICLYPTKFNNKASRGYISSLLLKYFSYRGYWSYYIPTDRPSIVVTPPHGIRYNIILPLLYLSSLFITKAYFHLVVY